jgi:hypothetical protein
MAAGIPDGGVAKEPGLQLGLTGIAPDTAQTSNGSNSEKLARVVHEVQRVFQGAQLIAVQARSKKRR